MSRRSRSRRLSAAVTVSLVLGACAGGEGSRPPSRAPKPDSVVSTPRGSSPTPTAEPTPLLITPREGLVDVRPSAWEKAEVLNQRTLLVRFWGGVEECYGVDRVEVKYGAEEVTLTVYEGLVPSAEVCIEIALLKAVRVSLDEPLAGRQIVDGASKAP